MPSPFPGMDPYLEHPDIFPGVHYSLNSYIREILQRNLPERYFAEVGQRVWVELSERYIEPVTSILQEQEHATENSIEEGDGGVASKVVTEPVVITVPHDEHRENYVEIYTRQEGGERLVTSIEVLSLSNKQPGSQSHELYLEKQQEILESQVHLVEIDLLRAGEHTTSVPYSYLKRKVGSVDYHICIHPFDKFNAYYVYPVQIQQQLPTISIPLLPEDGAVLLDLQEAFNRCYDTGPYARRIRYGEIKILPPLTKDQQKWAEQILQQQRQSSTSQ